MRCPYCNNVLEKLDQHETKGSTVPSRIPVVILTCPVCEVILGAVSKPKD